MYVSMNQARIEKEFLPDWARKGKRTNGWSCTGASSSPNTTKCVYKILVLDS
jgi:hypothetical protein